MGKKEKIVSIIDKAAVFFFAVLIFFLPISNAAIESCFGLIYLCFIARCIFERPALNQIKAFFKDRVNLALLVFYICIGLSMFVSGPLLKKSFHAWFFKWGEGALLFYFARLFIKKRHLKLLLAVFLASSFIVSVDGLYQKATGYDFIRNFKLFEVNSHAPRATFAHCNDFAAYLVVAFFILLGAVINYKKLNQRLILSALFIFISVNTLFTYSRGAVFSLVGSGMFLINSFIAKKTKLIIIGVILLFVLIAFSMPFSRQRLAYTFSGAGDANRFNMWRVALLMYDESPFFGKGLGLFMDNNNNKRYFENMGGITFENTQYAHNCYLQILAETGVLGLLSFLWFLGELLMRGYKRIATNKEPLFIGIFCAFLAFLIHSFFDTQLYSLKLAILFWILAAFLSVYISRDSLADNSSAP